MRVPTLRAERTRSHGVLAPVLLLVVSLVAASPAAQTNVLILLADDLGVDNVGVYAEGSDPPPTPNLDALASQGVLFRNAWANPGCSPTRATIVAGRFGLRTGIGWIVPGDDPLAYPLPLTETSLPEMLDLTTGGAYAHGCFGKWHLSSDVDGWPLAPNTHGWSWFEGSKANLLAPDDYFQWTKVTNGVTTTSTVYATTDTVDSVLAWVAAQTGPWVAYVPFHAPHNPFHAPPASLHTQDLSQAGPPATDPLPYFKAMVEALDTEIGRLLQGLGPQLASTVVIFLGDNGSPWSVTQPPFLPSKGKGTVYEGGINVPLIVAGPPVAFPGSECKALVNTTDVWATVAELVGGDTSLLPGGEVSPDTVSFAPYLALPDLPPLRKFVYAEVFRPNGLEGPYDLRSRAVRTGVYKLVRHAGKPDELYNLELDPFETSDLLATPPLGLAATIAYRDMIDFLREL